MVPNPATKVWHEGGMLKGEWSDRVLGDDGRYAEDSIILTAEVAEGERELNQALLNEYDKWVKATR